MWDANPELRLGQLIGNVYHSTDTGGIRQYYADDLDLIHEVEYYYDESSDGQGTVGTAHP